ncbi:hypothetical protein BH10PSE10_BH10PSE10_04560 [soil metagenome]
MTPRSILLAGFAVALLTSAPASAVTVQPNLTAPSLTESVAGGCGPGRWRGPYGGCRSTPFYGRLPNGYWQPEPHPFFGCPDGYWRGPWGHCRDTPYHGPLPGGGWK